MNTSEKPEGTVRINANVNKQTYHKLVDALAAAKKHHGHHVSQTALFYEAIDFLYTKHVLNAPKDNNATIITE